MVAPDSEKLVNGKKNKKDKKSKKSKSEIEVDTADNSAEFTVPNTEKPDSNKKKKLSKKSSNGEILDDSGVLQESEACENDCSDGVISSKKKKKKKNKEKENETYEPALECPGSDEKGEEKVKGKKKKKKSSKLLYEGYVDSVNGDKSNVTADGVFDADGLESANYCMSSEDVSIKSKKKKKKKSMESINSSADDKVEDKEEGSGKLNDNKESKKKKKRKSDDVEEMEKGSGKLNDNKESKKKKKRKNDKTDEDIQSQEGINTVLNESKCSKKVKKRKHVENDTAVVNEDIEASPVKERNKNKRKNKNDVDEVSESVREVEEKKPDGSSSSHTTVTKPEHSSSNISQSSLEPVITGQWKGSLFDNTDRQNKFMRLLGGMKKDSTSSGNKLFSNNAISKKKGLFGSLASKVPSNVALSSTAAADLNQKLEDEYNKALNMKIGGQRGIGLGFVKDPAEGKKFHIDANKTKSVQFDD